MLLQILETLTTGCAVELHSPKKVSIKFYDVEIKDLMNDYRIAQVIRILSLEQLIF